MGSSRFTILQVLNAGLYHFTHRISISYLGKFASLFIEFVPNTPGKPFPLEKGHLLSAKKIPFSAEKGIRGARGKPEDVRNPPDNLRGSVSERSAYSPPRAAEKKR